MEAEECVGLMASLDIISSLFREVGGETDVLDFGLGS